MPVEARTYRQPQVHVVADGRNGYIVRLYGADGVPKDLKTFKPSEAATDAGHREALARAGIAAGAFRDGVSEGLFQAHGILGQIIGMPS